LNLGFTLAFASAPTAPCCIGALVQILAESGGPAPLHQPLKEVVVQTPLSFLMDNLAFY